MSYAWVYLNICWILLQLLAWRKESGEMDEMCFFPIFLFFSPVFYSSTFLLYFLERIFPTLSSFPSSLYTEERRQGLSKSRQTLYDWTISQYSTNISKQIILCSRGLQFSRVSHAHVSWIQCLFLKAAVIIWIFCCFHKHICGSWILCCL